MDRINLLFELAAGLDWVGISVARIGLVAVLAEPGGVFNLASFMRMF